MIMEWDKCPSCGKVAPEDYEPPPMCCSGYECGCMGLPIEPYICSKECWNKLVLTAFNPTFDIFKNQKIRPEEVTTMKDMRGMPIAVGDTIAYKLTEASNVELSIGVVERFTTRNLYVSGRLKAPNTVLVINLPELPAE
jgi:hypothetical protein